MASLINLFNRSAVKHINNLNRVNVLAQNEARNVYSVLPELNFNQQASFIRNTTPTIISKYGEVAGVIGTTYYEEIRDLQSTVSNFKPYTPTVPAKFNFDDAIYNMMGYAIAINSNRGVSEMTNYLVNELTLHVSNYDRETIRYNADNDVVECTIQRVAEPSACSFCLTLAINDVTYTGSVDSLGDITEYANEWHSNCNCISSPVFKGMNTFRPDYYDDFQKVYDDARQRLKDEGIDVKVGSKKYETVLNKELGKRGRSYRKEAGLVNTFDDIKRFDPNIKDSDISVRDWLYNESERLSSLISSKGFKALDNRDVDILDTFFNISADELERDGLEKTLNITIKKDSLTTKNILPFVRDISGRK